MTSVLMEHSTARGKRLDERLHDVTWGLLLTFTGVVWLVPSEMAPQGSWFFGVAAILGAINVVRYLTHIHVHKFSLFLGLVALVAGLSELWRMELLPICLILIGLSLVVRPLLTKTT